MQTPDLSVPRRTSTRRGERGGEDTVSLIKSRDSQRENVKTCVWAAYGSLFPMVGITRTKVITVFPTFFWFFCGVSGWDRYHVLSRFLRVGLQTAVDKFYLFGFCHLSDRRAQHWIPWSSTTTLHVWGASQRRMPNGPGRFGSFEFQMCFPTRKVPQAACGRFTEKVPKTQN